MRGAYWLAVWVCLFLGAALSHAADDPVRVEHSKPLPPPPANTLATQFYERSATEKEATKDWKESELQSGGPDTESLKEQVGQRRAWFGIVREADEDKEKNETRLLVEMKYFDGLTDTHLQIVSIFGAGDFRAVIPGIGHKLKKLELVRIYGKVSSEEGGLPVISADLVRSWDWGLFAFMPYGEDSGNSEWAKLRKSDPDDAYSSHPDQKYYEERLGKR
jgi:hypothetical protein